MHGEGRGCRVGVGGGGLVGHETHALMCTSQRAVATADRCRGACISGQIGSECVSVINTIPV